MALRFCDSFDHYVSSQITQKWDGATAPGSRETVVAGGRSGSRLRVIQSSFIPGFVYKNLLPGSATVVIGLALMMDGFPSTGDGYISFYEGAGATKHLDLRRDSFGRFYVTRNGTTLGVGVTAVPNGSWCHVELKVVIHDTAGSVLLKVNGATDLSLTNVDTRNGGTSGIIERVYLRAPGTSNDAFYADDVWIDDADMHGDLRVEALLPSGAGAHSDFAPSAGSNFQNVDDASPDDDSTYNASSTVGAKDTFAFGNLVTTAGTIAAIQRITRWRKDDAGARTTRQVLRVGGVDFSGSDVVLADSYASSLESAEQNPATSADWTIADVNALEAGYELVS